MDIAAAVRIKNMSMRMMKSIVYFVVHPVMVIVLVALRATINMGEGIINVFGVVLKVLAIVAVAHTRNMKNEGGLTRRLWRSILEYSTSCTHKAAEDILPIRRWLIAIRFFILIQEDKMSFSS